MLSSKNKLKGLKSVLVSVRSFVPFSSKSTQANELFKEKMVTFNLPVNK